MLREAIALTLIGMGVVFASLIALMYVIRLLNRAFAGGNEATEGQAPAVAEAGPAEDAIPLALAAAAGYFLETEGPEAFIPPVRRGGASEWARRARGGVPGWRPR